MKKTEIDIYDSWEKLSTPKQKGAFEIIQYFKTNLWILKNNLGCFGFLLTDTISKLDSDYKNITSDWKRSLKNKEGRVLNRCLIIESKINIDSKLFCNAITSLLDIKDKNKLYTINEISEALIKIEEITIKETDEFNEVVGVWGELYLINELITHNNNIEEVKEDIIQSWEGLNTRSKIDFNFKSRLLKIEVKTTTETFRIHHFNTLDQVSTNSNYNGFLASFCILPDDNGLTCNDILNSIKNKLPKNLVLNLEKKIKIRGKVCNNTKYHFIINQNKQFEFYRFKDVPKPIIEEGISKIEWQAILDNKVTINKKGKEALLKLKV
jgi:hypothetical protein